MTKIIDFNKDTLYYLNLSDKRVENGDYPGSIVALHKGIRCYKIEQEWEEAVLLLAQTYSDMGKLELSNKFYFLLLKENSCQLDSFFGLSQNFFMQGNIPLSEYYLSQMSAVDESFTPPDINEVFQIEDKKERTPLGYKIVYPIKTEIRKESSKLIEYGEFEKAITLLESASEEDGEFLEIQNDLVFCYVLTQKFGKALTTSKKILKVQKDNVFALCGLLYSAKMKNQLKTYDETLEAIKAIKQMDEGEKIKVATTMCEVGEHKLACEYLKEVNQIKPYFELFQILLGIAFINACEFDKALNEFSTMLKIDYENTIAKYYFRLAKERKEEFEIGCTSFSELSYLPQVPYLEIAKRMTAIKDTLDHYDIGTLDDGDSTLSEYIDWLFTTQEVKVQIDYLDCIICSDLLSREERIDEILLKEDLNIQLKAMALESCAEKDGKEISYVLYGKFCQTTVEHPTFYQNYPPIFKRAYKKVFALVTILKGDEEYDINTACDACVMMYIKNNCDFRSLDTVVTLLFAIITEGSMDIDNICNILNVKPATLKSYRKKLFQS